MSFYGQQDFATKVRTGTVAGWAARTLIGHTDTVGTNLRILHAETNVADLDSTALFDTPATVKVASTDNTADTGAGTGALTVRVYGVNSAGAEITEDFTLNGQTETAASSATFSCVYRIETLTAGNGGSNAGVIWVGNGTFTTGVPATKYGSMEIGTNISAMAIYQVPTGKSLYLTEAQVLLADSAKLMNAQFVRYNGLEYEIFDVHHQLEKMSFRADQYPAIPADNLIFVRANVDTSTAKATISLAGYLVDD